MRSVRIQRSDVGHHVNRIGQVASVRAVIACRLAAANRSIHMMVVRSGLRRLLLVEMIIGQLVRMLMCVRMVLRIIVVVQVIQATLIIRKWRRLLRWWLLLLLLLVVKQATSGVVLFGGNCGEIIIHRRIRRLTSSEVKWFFRNGWRHVGAGS